MALMDYMLDDAIGHWERFLVYGLLNDRDKVVIYNQLLAFVSLRDIKSLVDRQPFYYSDNLRLIVKYKSVSIQLGK